MGEEATDGDNTAWQHSFSFAAEDDYFHVSVRFSGKETITEREAYYDEVASRLTARQKETVLRLEQELAERDLCSFNKFTNLDIYNAVLEGHVSSLAEFLKLHGYDMEKIYREEDLFPREITNYDEEEYGFLFYNEDNKDSFDSNHAIIFRDKVSDIHRVLDDITAFYKQKGIKPAIYQSITDDGYFESVHEELIQHGYAVRSEEQRYMLLLADCTICPGPDIEVRREKEWSDAFRTDIFEAAGEPWEIAVARRAIEKENTLFFVAYIDGRPAGMMYAHTKDGVCRADYLLVATNHRRKGAARAILHAFVQYCKDNGIKNCFLWPAGESAEKIYLEAGFRLVEAKKAGRAWYDEP